ncbi:MAG: RHS repeat-associated core domain-containing protein, partial [Bacteroidales bacterium]|nr:RHS repeat-associated core domain-containing protein [Bacteroidales bacterium]
TSSTANPRLRRGFTGHEHLQQFGLIDMQARLYDPHLGRFLAPDPYVQAPENHQSLNRYAYCMNNPLKYVDPNGEFSVLAVLAGAAIGGIINLVANAQNIDNIWEGIASFAVGAGAGALTAVTGGATSGFWASAWTGLAAAGVSSASVSATNNIVKQLNKERGFSDINWKSVGHDALYAFGGGMAAYGTNTILSCTLENSILKNTIKHIGNRFAYNVVGKTITGKNPFKNINHHTLGMDLSILFPLAVDGITYGMNQSQIPNKIMNRKYRKEAETDNGYLDMKEAVDRYTKETGESTSIINNGFNDAKVSWGGSMYIDGKCGFTVEGIEGLNGLEEFGIYRGFRPLHNVDLFLIYSLFLN